MKKLTLQQIGSILFCVVGFFILLTSVDLGLVGFLYLAFGIYYVFKYFGIATRSHSGWYAVKVLFESVHAEDKNENLKLFEESIFLVKAFHEDEANEKAKVFAKKAEHEYVNTYGVSIKSQFVTILHTFELNDHELTDGTEIYARYIHAQKEDSAKIISKRYYPEAKPIE